MQVTLTLRTGEGENQRIINYVNLVNPLAVERCTGGIGDPNQASIILRGGGRLDCVETLDELAAEWSDAVSGVTPPQEG